ncbi:protein terminal ear1-like [Coffea eugenioides]|uniref:protein terminal ear1-like n=1 Tax=Coffea eugenioides TaxID=49369 RepID=UPI000F5CF16B|nr:protein terminal ear1-like [Coffea arabica]XP_027150347.1 protein terminal ear1-like [Coffea eugenioides]
MATRLNPFAESWMPNAPKPSKTPIMFPHEVTCQPSPCFGTFQRPLLQPQPPLAIYGECYYFYGFCSYYYTLRFQPQPIPTTVLPPGMLSCALDEKDIEEKRDSRVSCGENGKDWKVTGGVVPRPRPRMRKSRSLENQGTSKKTLKQVWKPRKAKSDDGVGGGDAVVCTSSSSSPSPPPTAPVKEDSAFCSYTTVMIKNIPNQYRRNDLMQLLDIYCKNYDLEYDFLYLPMDFWRKDNLGYAFVNFTSATAAKKIKDLLHGYVWCGNKIQDGIIHSKKICEMSWAHIQGRDALIKHFLDSYFTCDNIEYLPVVLSPPRNGSNSGILPIPIGTMTGLSKSCRPTEKKSSIITNLAHTTTLS